MWNHSRLGVPDYAAIALAAMLFTAPVVTAADEIEVRAAWRVLSKHAVLYKRALVFATFNNGFLVRKEGDQRWLAIAANGDRVARLRGMGALASALPVDIPETNAGFRTPDELTAEGAALLQFILSTHEGDVHEITIARGPGNDLIALCAGAIALNLWIRDQKISVFALEPGLPSDEERLCNVLRAALQLDWTIVTQVLSVGRYGLVTEQQGGRYINTISGAKGDGPLRKREVAAVDTVLPRLQAMPSRFLVRVSDAELRLSWEELLRASVWASDHWATKLNQSPAILMTR